MRAEKSSRRAPRLRRAVCTRGICIPPPIPPSGKPVKDEIGVRIVGLLFAALRALERQALLFRDLILPRKIRQGQRPGVGGEKGRRLVRRIVIVSLPDNRPMSRGRREGGLRGGFQRRRIPSGNGRQGEGRREREGNGRRPRHSPSPLPPRGRRELSPIASPSVPDGRDRRNQQGRAHRGVRNAIFRVHGRDYNPSPPKCQFFFLVAMPRRRHAGPRIPPVGRRNEEKITVIAEFSGATKSRRKISATSRERGPTPANAESKPPFGGSRGYFRRSENSAMTASPFIPPCRR